MNTEQLISHTTATPVDTIASLQGSDGGFFSVSEVHELLTKIHDSLDITVSKQAGTTACIFRISFQFCLQAASEV